MQECLFVFFGKVFNAGISMKTTLTGKKKRKKKKTITTVKKFQHSFHQYCHYQNLFTQILESKRVLIESEICHTIEDNEC